MEEMIAATMAALMVVDGPGWEVIKVGGAQRGQAGHDADFIVTHSQPGRCTRILGRVLHLNIMKPLRRF